MTGSSGKSSKWPSLHRQTQFERQIAHGRILVAEVHLHDVVEARALQESVLAAWRRKNEPIQTATALNNLAFTIRNLGDLSHAYELMNESEGIFRREFGETHVKSVHAHETLDMIECEIRQISEEDPGT